MTQQRDLESITRWELVIGLQKSKLGNMKLTGRERERDAPRLGAVVPLRGRAARRPAAEKGDDVGEETDLGQPGHIQL